jgi:hypothetical protein
MVFSVRSATEATNGHLEIAIIAKKEEPRQDSSKGKVMLELFFTHLELFTWNSSQKERL